MKKALLLFILIIGFLFPLTAAADNYVTVTAGEEFITDASEQGKTEIAKITGMTTKELKVFYDSNGIIYLAVNKDNSKQIRITCSKNKFSEGLNNISVLSDDEINTIIPSITGLSAEECLIVDKKSQKFIRSEQKLSDSGGEFTLIQYVTVAANKNYVLSFYTSSQANTDYASKVFKDYDCDDFLNDSVKSDSRVNYAVISAAVVVAAVGAILIYTFIKDICNSVNAKNPSKSAEDDDEENKFAVSTGKKS